MFHKNSNNNQGAFLELLVAAKKSYLDVFKEMVFLYCIEEIITYVSYPKSLS